MNLKSLLAPCGLVLFATVLPAQSVGHNLLDGLRGGFGEVHTAVMKSADLVVCRSGATTLAELTASARPSILIPFPGATDDHQRTNAEALAKVGAATMIDQRDLTGERLAREILSLAGNEAERRRMGEAAAGMARPDATRVIVDKVLELAR